MMKFPLFKQAFITLVIVGVMYQVALYLHLFYTIAWFDMVMHFMGGFFISISALALFTWDNKPRSYGILLLWGIVAALVVGIAWEFFEFYAGLTDWYAFEYMGDTGMDIVMDIFGALVAVWYSFTKLNKINS